MWGQSQDFVTGSIQTQIQINFDIICVNNVVSDVVALRRVEMMGITIGFAWKPEAEVDTKNVELLISKAEDIYKDGFDQCFDNQDLAVEAVRYSTYNLEQWNADGGSFCACPSLEPGVYQFVFRVDNGKEKELKISDYYETTFLGSGRAVNYIELPGNSKVDNRSNTKNKRKSK